MKRFLLPILILCVTLQPRAEQITVATYNVENFRTHFLAHKITTSKPSWMNDPLAKELIDAEREQNDKANWEVSQVILDPKFNPDILVMQEGCSQSDLDYFNKRWLKDAFKTVIVFETNSERDQNLCMLIKPGFTIVDRKDQYFKEPDSEKNERGDRLFARGPAFVQIQAPSGYRFWVGTNHQKSKSGNSVEVTKWRLREAKRTHQIIKELEKTGPDDVVFLGDMNDELGLQKFEQEAGGDAIATIVGPAQDGIVLETKPLADAGEISYGGYWKPDFRSFIDHVFVTQEMKDQVEDVKVFQNNFTQVASDHYPVMIRFHADQANK